MTTATENTGAATAGQRIAEGVAIALIGALIGSILFPGPGTALGAKLGALVGGGAR